MKRLERGARSKNKKVTMTTTAGVSLSSPRVLAKASSSTQTAQTIKLPVLLSQMWPVKFGSERIMIPRPVRAASKGISEKVEESVKKAEQTCSDDPVGGECVLAWDEVEELSVAASRARDKKKASEPLENYCKDNPEVDECHSYDN